MTRFEKTKTRWETEQEQRLRQERLDKLRASRQDDQRRQQRVEESRLATREALRTELRQEIRSRRAEEARTELWKDLRHEEQLQQWKAARRAQILERQRQERQAGLIRSERHAVIRPLRKSGEPPARREAGASTEHFREHPEEEQRRARTARLRERHQLVRQIQNAQAERKKELRTQHFRERLEARAARLQEQQQLLRQSEAAQEQRQNEWRAEDLSSRRERGQLEARVTRLQEQQHQVRQKETAQDQRGMEARTARLDARREQERRKTQRVQYREQQQSRLQQLVQRRKESKRRAAHIEQSGRRRASGELPVSSSRRPLQRLNKRRAEKQVSSRILQRQAVSSALLAGNVEPEFPLDELPRLSTRGSFIVDELWNPVYLRGVTIRGLDEVNPKGAQTVPNALSLDDRNLSTLTDLWGANLVRIPFQAQTVLSGNGFLSSDKILQGLDECVATVTQLGAYVLLALEPTPRDGSPLVPDDDSFRIWRLLANHYQDEPGVLYEIFASLEPLANTWLETALMLIGTIRLENPASLIFLGSGRGGANVSGLPLRFSTADPVFNVAYTIGISPQYPPIAVDPQLRTLAASYPICVSMWSDGGTDLGRSSQAVVNLFEGYGMGWVASSWNVEPRLVTNATTHDLSSTRWGLIVQRALVQPVKPLLPPLV